MAFHVYHQVFFFILHSHFVFYLYLCLADFSVRKGFGIIGKGVVLAQLVKGVVLDAIGYLGADLLIRKMYMYFSCLLLWYFSMSIS
jgi:hypothetical protein